MELFRNWIIAVTVSAMLIAIADSVMPDGTVKKVGKLTGGLVLMLGILQPIMKLDYEELYCMANGLEGITVANLEEGTVKNGQLLKTIIEQQMNAYVLDKAEELGSSCTVDVTCELGENEVPYPDRIKIMGTLTPRQKQELSEYLKNDLGIPGSNQQYLNEDGS